MTPYAALLSLRQVEEQQAEVAMAEALRGVAAAAGVMARVRAARAAWLEAEVAAPAALLTGLEAAELAADLRLAEARQLAAAARETLIERQRERKVVEKLHNDALAAAAQAEARRAQAELDDLGSRARSPLSETAR